MMIKIEKKACWFGRVGDGSDPTQGYRAHELGTQAEGHKRMFGAEKSPKRQRRRTARTFSKKKITQI